MYLNKCVYRSIIVYVLYKYMQVGLYVFTQMYVQIYYCVCIIYIYAGRPICIYTNVCTDLLLCMYYIYVKSSTSIYA